MANYLSYLSGNFTLARPAWNIPRDAGAMSDALFVCKQLGLTQKRRQRERRPTLAELDLLLGHFLDRATQRPSSVPMHRIMAFAFVSTRRQEEITRIR